MQMHEEEAPDTLEAGGPTQSGSCGPRTWHRGRGRLVRLRPGRPSLQQKPETHYEGQSADHVGIVPIRRSAGPPASAISGAHFDSTFRPASGAGLGSLLPH